MSTTASQTPDTIQQRGIDATRRLRELLGLSDLKILSTALAEYVVEESDRNPDITDRIRALYDDLTRLKPTRAVRSSRANSGADVVLTPLKQIAGYRDNPYGPLDPYFLLDVYGAHQLRPAITGYSLGRLKSTLPLVEEKNPGTRPTSRAKKDAIIAYIVEHVAGPGY